MPPVEHPGSAAAPRRSARWRGLATANLLVCYTLFMLAATGYRNRVLADGFGWPAVSRIGPVYNGVLIAALFVLAYQTFALRRESRWYTVAGVGALAAALWMLLALLVPRPALVG